LKINLGKLAACVVILTGAIGAFFWLFNISAVASDAQQRTIQNAAQIEKKADKDATQEQLKRIFDELQSIDSYLRSQK